MRDQVEKVIEKIRPMLLADGGDVDVVSVENGMVQLRLRGACVGCPASMVTLHEGIEKLLKEEVPGVVGVEAVP